jgi:chromosome partitioning protein
MIITVASYKGGVGKTTTAIHCAAYLQHKAPSLLIDGDPNRSATGWAKRGNGLPFKVVDERQATRYVRDYEHIVIDTQAHPNREDLEALTDGCDLLVLPSTPDALALDALLATVEMLKSLGSDRYRVLLTMIPPRPSRDGEEAQAMLRDAGLPVFDTMIRRYVAFQKAALAGVTVEAATDPRAPMAWEDYQTTGKEILP